MIGRRLQSALADKATAYGVTTNVIITNLLINFGVFLACALIFALSKARPSLRKAFSPRTFYCPNATPREPSSWHPLQWMYYVRALPEDVFMKKIGLDALMFVKTNACLARSLSLSALIGCFVLVPVNTSFGYIRANVHSGGTSFAQYTIANVSEQSSVFYIHVLAAYLVTFVSMTGLRNLYLEYVQLRHLHLLSRDGRTPQQHTVMLHHIPKPLQSATAMFRFFSAIFPGQVASIAIVLRLPHLHELIAKYHFCVGRFEHALRATLSSAKHGSPRRPKVKRRVWNGETGQPLGWTYGWSSGIGWPFIETVEVDAISYWHGEVVRLRAQVQKERQQCAAWHAKFERRQASLDMLSSMRSRSRKDTRSTDSLHGGGRDKRTALAKSVSLDASFAGTHPSRRTAGIPATVDESSEFKESQAAEHPYSLSKDSGAESDELLWSRLNDASTGYTDLHIVRDSSAESSGSLRHRRRKVSRDRAYSSSMPGYMREQLRSSDRVSCDQKLGDSTDSMPTSEEDKCDGQLPQDMSSSDNAHMTVFEMVRRRVFSSGGSAGFSFGAHGRSGFSPFSSTRSLSGGRIDASRHLASENKGEQCTCFSFCVDADSERPVFAGWQAEWFQAASPAAIQEAVSKTVHYVLGNPLSSTAFVTFYTLSAASITRAYNGSLHPTPSAMISSSSAQKADWSLADPDAASYTPEPRDLFWKNVCETWQKRPLQGLAGQTFAVVIIIAIAVPVAIISGFANVDSLRDKFTFIDESVVDSTFVANLLALISPLLLMWLINLVPPILAAFQRFVSNEARSLSENQALVFRRFFSFLFYNAFLVLAVSTSAYEMAFEAVNDPRSAAASLGVSLPKSSAFYIQFIIIRTFAGLGVELARINRFLLAGIKYILAGPDVTEHQRETPVLGCRSIDRPGPLYYGRYYADALLVYLLSIAYSTVAPLILPFGAMYFAGAYVVFKRQLAYVYEKEYETGGALWPGVQRRCVICIVTSHVVLGCVLAAKLAWSPLSLLLPLPVLTMVWQQFMTRIYGNASRSLPLSVAAHEDKLMDDRLSASNESFVESDQFAQIRDAYTQPELKQELQGIDLELVRYARMLGVHIEDPEIAADVENPIRSPPDIQRQPSAEEEKLLE